VGDQWITETPRAAAFQVTKKKNPAVGTPGQTFLLSEFTVSSMRPGCCSPRFGAMNHFVFVVQPVFFSSCSILLFFCRRFLI
jgi:hypothetical protein